MILTIIYLALMFKFIFGVWQRKTEWWILISSLACVTGATIALIPIVDVLKLSNLEFSVFYTIFLALSFLFIKRLELFKRIILF
ncbi:MAG: hypothetical protein CMN89_06470 [Sutterellaceae bacterium]|nr:hypothetical protein [Sutterellaceae bacterium]MBT84116.1 hypothetical protein [Sutterellaceae bacterium]|tara:strand:+ start:774 stop:1025 length:252 start_codon:yes stop_codon:yes gene_type:complete